jgi:hypothetical protein
MTFITTPDDGVSRMDTDSISSWLIAQENLTEFKKDFIFIVWEQEILNFLVLWDQVPDFILEVMVLVLINATAWPAELHRCH